jgi:hypothetical protein
MVLDRELSYEEKELDFAGAPQRTTRATSVLVLSENDPWLRVAPLLCPAFRDGYR